MKAIRKLKCAVNVSRSFERMVKLIIPYKTQYFEQVMGFILCLKFEYKK